MKFKLLFILLFISINFFATGQEPNFIKIDGKEYDLLNDPLEKYFQEHPENHPIFGEKFIKKDEKGETYFTTSTGNWRGYVAYFEIINNELFLTDLKIDDSNSGLLISVYNKIFPDTKTVKLNYSGILTVPTGDFIDSDNFGFSSYYKSYLLLTIKNDHLEKIKELQNKDYMKFKIKQFEEFQKTKDYKIAYEDYLKSNTESEKIELSFAKTKRKIAEIKKQYSKKPTKKQIDGFLFMMSNLEQIYVDY